MATAKDFFARRPHIIPAAIATAFLLGALGNWPYDYYRLLRWVVCAAAVFVAYKSWTYRQAWGTWAFGCAAVLFNPLVPFHIKRDTWQVIDLLAAAIFVVGVVVLRRPTTGKANGGP
jgi:hypothetical protein